MATQTFYRSLLSKNRTLTSLLSRPYSSFSSSAAAAASHKTLAAPSPPSSLSFLRRFRGPLCSPLLHRSSISSAARSFATRAARSSLNDPNPNYSNRPPKETILLDGCDFEHWLVVMEPPNPDATRDDIIDSYIKTLAQIVGSEDEARMKIYSVSTRHYYAFGALVSEELSYKLKELPGVRWVLPDSYLDVKNKDYGGEPFINGQAVPYDEKYHAEWVRNNARANERNRRNDRPRNYDRSRNYERRRENMQPPPNQGMQNAGPQGPGMHPPPPQGPGMHPPQGPGMHPPNQGMQNFPQNRGMPPNNQGVQNYAPQNPGMHPNNHGMPPNNQGMWNGAPGMPPNNMGGNQGWGNAQNFQHNPNNGYAPHQGPTPNGQFQNSSHDPNMGGGPGRNYQS